MTVFAYDMAFDTSPPGLILNKFGLFVRDSILSGQNPDHMKNCSNYGVIAGIGSLTFSAP